MRESFDLSHGGVRGSWRAAGREAEIDYETRTRRKEEEGLIGFAADFAIGCRTFSRHCRRPI